MHHRVKSNRKLHRFHVADVHSAYGDRLLTLSRYAMDSVKESLGRAANEHKRHECTRILREAGEYLSRRYQENVRVFDCGFDRIATCGGRDSVLHASAFVDRVETLDVLQEHVGGANVPPCPSIVDLLVVNRALHDWLVADQDNVAFLLTFGHSATNIFTSSFLAYSGVYSDAIFALNALAREKRSEWSGFNCLRRAARLFWPANGAESKGCTIFVLMTSEGSLNQVSIYANMLITAPHADAYLVCDLQRRAAQLELLAKFSFLLSHSMERNRIDSSRRPVVIESITCSSAPTFTASDSNCQSALAGCRPCVHLLGMRSACVSVYNANAAPAGT